LSLDFLQIISESKSPEIIQRSKDFALRIMV